MGNDNGVTMSPWGVYSSKDVTPDVSICFCCAYEKYTHAEIDNKFHEISLPCENVSSINVSSHCNNFIECNNFAFACVLRPVNYMDSNFWTQKWLVSE